MTYILTVCLNPVIQKTLILDELKENEVNRSTRYYKDISGKGINVSRVLVQAGEKVVHLTHSGGEKKELFRDWCKREGIRAHIPDSRTEIRECQTLISLKNHTTTEIVEEALPVPPETEKKIRKKYEKLLRGAEVITISGTKAPGYTSDIYPWMTTEARKQGKKIILDIKGADLKNCLPSKPSLIKPNFSEFMESFTGRKILENEDSSTFLEEAKQIMRKIHRHYGCEIILTRGKEETLCYDGKEFALVPPEKLETPLNTTGCGDAFTAGLAQALKNNKSLSRGIALGHHYARLNALQLRPGYIL